MKKLISILFLGIFTVVSEADVLRLEADSKNLRLLYGQTVISPKIEVFIAESGWRTLLRSDKTGYSKIGGTGKWVHRAESDSGNIILQAKSKNGKVYLSAEFDIPPESMAHNICLDIFLDKKLFYESLKEQPGKMPRPLVAKTAIGTLIVTPLSSWNPWVIRDESKSEWRGSDYRTISLLSLSKKEVSEPFRKTVRLSFEFVSAEEPMTAIRTVELKNFETALRKTGEVSAEFDAAAQRLSTEKLDATKLDLIEKTFIAEARSRKCYLNTAFAGIVIPLPFANEKKNGKFVFPDKVTVNATDSKAGIAAAILEDELTRYRGIPAGGTARIIINSASELPGEGYSIKITPDSIMISGKGVTGTINGVQTLIQLLKKDSSGRIYADSCEIRDWPGSKFRGIQLIPSNRLGTGFLRDAIRRLVSRYKYNVLVFGEDSTGNMEWKSHPKITSQFRMSSNEVKKIIEYAKAHKLKIIPLIQSLGHNSNTLKAYPELADGGDSSSLCLSHPGTRKLLADLYDEAIELYQPEYVHIGCDESFSVGRNKLCKGRKPADLLAEHLNWCHDYLKKKGCKTIMWHDMLLESGKWSSPANSHKSLITHPALEKLNRDIIIDLWTYKEKDDFPALAHFRKKGFQVLGSGWYTPENYIMLEKAIRKNDGMGTIATTWMFELFGSTDLTSVAGADAAWRCNGDQNQFFSDMLYSAHAHAAMLPPQPSEFAGTATVPVSLEKFINAPLDKKLEILPAGMVDFSNLNFEIAPYGKNRCVAVDSQQRSPAITLSGTASGLVFLHTVNTLTSDKKVGYYEITYADGTMIQTELYNRRNIFGATLPPLSADFDKKLFGGFFPLSKPVWRGCSISGEPLTLQAFEWLNPHPDKMLKCVELICNADPSVRISLIALSTIKNNI